MISENFQIGKVLGRLGAKPSIAADDNQFGCPRDKRSKS
jgi:hypothetical protein